MTNKQKLHSGLTSHEDKIFIQEKFRKLQEKMSMNGTISNILTGFLVFVHTVLTLIDVVGVTNLADFMIRCDGTQQDPNAMTAIEKVLVTMIAFPFWTIVVAFMIAPRPSAALISAATHSSYTLHQVIHHETWQELFHPHTDLTMEFFIYSKIVWIMISLLIWYLSTSTTNKEERANKNKSA